MVIGGATMEGTIMHTVYVKDFVTLPCDDASPGIRQAIDVARRQGADTLMFEAGVYPLQSSTSIETDLTTHDISAVGVTALDVCILLKDLNHFHLVGQVDADGQPTTELAGPNDLREHDLLPAILWCDNCHDLHISNLKLYRLPNYGTAAVVTGVDADGLTVQVLPGNPCYDRMPVYCMNRFDRESRTLLGESLTYGNGIGKYFRLTGDRQLRLDDPTLAGRVESGNVLSWHQGAKTIFQFFLGNCDDVYLDNILTTNANGFAMLGFNLHNLHAEKVVIKPEGNQYFSAPRDGWKLHKCHGVIEINGMVIEGVRMDGQNMHSNYLMVEQVLAPNKLQLFSCYSYLPLLNGTFIEFYNDELVQTAEIGSWSNGGPMYKDDRTGYKYIVEFTSAVPAFVAVGTLALATCWEPTQYSCRNSSFTNIAGAGHLSRIDHMRIENCHYKNLMNPGILMGAEFPVHHEGGHCNDVLIRDCSFDNCGFFPRYGASGCIAIKSDGFSGAYNGDIRIVDCQFKNSNIGVDIHDAHDVILEHCSFENVKNPVNDLCHAVVDDGVPD